MDVLNFKSEFDKQLGKLKVPSDCTLQEPSWEVTRPPYFWQVELFFCFKDDAHIRVWESYEKLGGLQLSRRKQWAYHYGPVTRRDSAGNAVHGDPDDPLVIRIDTCSGLHLHLNARDPHYEQDRLKGLQLQDVDWRAFVNSVFTHRKTGKAINKILGFTLDVNA